MWKKWKMNKDMKTNLLFITWIICMLACSLPASGQEAKKDQRKMDRQAFQAKRNAYITAEIGLTADEAAEFIPLDNELKQKLFEAGRECRKLTRESLEKENVPDATYLKLIDCNLDSRIKALQLEKEYYEKFKQILPPQKLYKYQHADMKFMKEFMRDENPPGHDKKMPPPPSRKKR
jgi:hypothetical protein